MTEPLFFAQHRRTAPWLTRGAWPFHWLHGEVTAPVIGAFRLRFTSPQAESLRVVVTADERYRLYCDGRLVSSGPEIGSRYRWLADAVDLQVAAGEHLLYAVVWSVGVEDGDYATDGIMPGFALGVDGAANDRLATGSAPWEWHALPGYVMRKNPLAHWTVPDVQRDAAATDWAVEEGGGAGWRPARAGSEVHHVADVEAYPSRLVDIGTLPPVTLRRWTSATVRHAESLGVEVSDPDALPLGTAAPEWMRAGDALLRGAQCLEVPPHSQIRLVIDCGNYLTAWPELRAGGAGGTIDLQWMEALALQPVGGHAIQKGQRDAIDGRYVGGTGDRFVLDGVQRQYRPLYWRAGRFLIATIRTEAQPVAITQLQLQEDRYPLEQEARLEVADPALMRVLPLCLRTLQANAHDQYSDTPYYERMQYIGDCRIDCLNTYILTADDRLPLKALRMIDAQRLPNGLTVSRAPTRNLQVIPPFSLWYIGMVRDHLWWRGNPALVRYLMPGVRGILDRFLRAVRDDGTVGQIDGWNFCDWAAGFPHGEPPGSDEGSGPLNLQALMALQWAVELEEALGEPELAARWRRLATALASAISTHFWDDARSAWTDARGDRTGRLSQHAQVLATLCRSLDPARCQRGMARIASDPGMVASSVYFSHYLIEAWAVLGDGERIARVLDFWRAIPAQGFCTLPEQPEPSRSDCHAWSAHPLYHVAATIAGIRPAAPGFTAVTIAPCPGALPALTVDIPHPGGGRIQAELSFATGRCSGRIVLPVGIGGSFLWQGRTLALQPGVNALP